MTRPAPRSRAARRRQATVVVAVLCAGYVLSMFYRTSIGVIGDELARAMALSAAALGTLGGIYFLVFAAAQIPLGIALDRYGPRRVNASMLLIAALGALVFAAADGFAVLALGRGLIGLGCAAGLMGALVAFARWFPPRRFSAMAGFMLAVGGLGSLVSTTPLALGAAWLGWRGAFVLAAGVTVAAAALTLACVRDAPPGAPAAAGRRETLGETIRGVGTVLRNRQLHLLLPLNACAYSAIMALLALWGAPYLAHVHGLDAVGAAEIMMAMAVALMLGSLSYGWLGARIGANKTVVLAGAAATCVIYAALAAGLVAGPAAAAVALCLIGLLGGYAALMLSHIRALFPDRLVGRGLTTANLFNFGGSGVIQAASGWIVGRWPKAGDAHSPDAYAALFLFLAGLVAVSAVFYAFARRPDLASAPAAGASG